MNSYEIEEGRFVSRQRVHQLRNPKKFRELQKRYYESHKEEIAEKARAWRENFKKVHGMSYYQWRKQNVKADDEKTTP